MGQILHGSATTTKAARRAIQYSQASIRTLAQCYGISLSTVQTMEETLFNARCADGTEGDSLNSFICGRRSDVRSVPQTYAIAAG